MKTNNFTLIKETNLQNMLFLLKILSLFFAAIPIFQKYSTSSAYIDYLDFQNSLILTTITFVIMGIVILLWCMLNASHHKYHQIKYLEIATLFILYTFSIYITDPTTNAYKYLYLILIITYTIEYGNNIGTIIAIIAAAVTLLPGIFSPRYAVTYDSDLAISSLFIVIAWTLGYYVKLEQTHIDYLTNIANIDGLTGIFNHRYFHECLDKYCKESKNKHSQLSLIILDIDFFKEYNDLFGHREGDLLIKTIVELISNSLREQDLLFRYGGDEFCIILLDTTEEEAIQIGERLRNIINSYKKEGMEHMPNKKLSVSIGVAAISEDVDSHLSLIDKADSALYRAKYLRKNRVEAYGAVWGAFQEMSDLNIDDITKHVKTLISVIDAKDKYTYFHIERVAHYCELFADYLKLSADEKRFLIIGAYLHDLGKINIAKDILISDRKLTTEEWNELKAHPVESVAIIEKIDGFDEVIPIVRHHHERYDGSGYPDNLAAEEIPELARILSVVDSFDAMTHKRPYQKTKTINEAINELIRCKGTQFDSEYVDHFINMLEETM